MENVPPVPVDRGRDDRPAHNFGPGAPGLLDPGCHALDIGRRRETSDLALRDDFIRLQFHNHPSRGGFLASQALEGMILHGALGSL